MKFEATVNIEGVELQIESWVDKGGTFSDHPYPPIVEDTEIEIDKVSVGDVDITEIFDFGRHQEEILIQLHELVKN